MGRIKTTLVKRSTLRLMASHSDEFTGDFKQDKQKMRQFAIISSKKLRNKIAGYVARLASKREEL